MPDYSQLSDAQLMQLYQLQGQESSHAPDSSTVQSPKGASGNMQVMPTTSKDPGFGVKPSNGTPQDTAREGQDYYLALSNKYKDPTVAAIAYNWGPGNTDKWLSSGADLSKVPDETLKYAYNFNKANPGKPTLDNVDSPAKQRGMAALQQMAPNTQAIGNAVTGIGETAGQMASGTFGLAAGALHGAADLATGSSFDQAHQDLQKEENAVTYQPKTEAGQQISQNVSQMFDKYLDKPLMQGGQYVGEAAGLDPTTANQVAQVGSSLFENLALPGLLHGVMPRGAGAEITDTGAAGQLDTMGNLGKPGPEMPPNAGPQQPGFQENVPYRQYFQQPDLFDQNTQGMQPEGPTLAGSTAPEAFPVEGARGSLSNARQMDLQLDNQEPISVGSNGEAMTADQARDVAPFRDLMQQRTEQLRQLAPEQLDIFSDTPAEHLANDFEEGKDLPEARSLSPEEFEQTVTDLATKDGTRFPLPEDMEAAYSRYLDTVRDDQGGLFDRASMAENFAKIAVDEALERRVSEHPVVRANQKSLDHLMEQDQSVPGVARETKAAEDRLQKSQDNIRKYFEPTAKAATPFYAKDGTVHMYTFGYLPEMMKSIGALLKGIHGVVFKTLDRMIPNFKTLDSFGKIAGQGVKDFVNRQANKDWGQSVNEQPKAVLKGVDGLREGLKDYLPHDEEIDPAQLKVQMQQEPDMSAGKARSALRNNILTGQQLQAFTHHPLVKYAVNTVDRAMRNAQQFVRDQLVGKDGLRTKVRSMSDDELTGIWSTMEMNEGVKEFSESELRNAGFNEKQMDFYKQRQMLNDRKLQDLNDGRAQAGLAPVDRRIAHIAGHFLGDFKTLIKDADGTVKAVVAHNNRGAVKTIANRVLEQLGEGHTMSPIEMRKLSEGGMTDRYTGYMNILNDMASRDPVVDQVVQAYKEYMSNDAQAAMRYRAAFKSKTGVIGAEGRKSWLSAKENAKAGVQNELKALESMNTWSEMQKAISKIKDFQADPDINAPNAKATVQAYLDNVQHRNQGMGAFLANSVVNGFGELTGIGPSALNHISNIGKEGLLTMFIGLGKLSHSFVTLIQPLQGIPVVNSLMKAEGAKLGLTQLTAALKSMGSQSHILGALAKGADVTDPFLKRALEFAKDNDTFNSSQFKFGNLTDVNPGNKMRVAKQIAEFNVTGMESATRSFTYMYYSHMLKDLGMPEKEIFPAAHNAMKDVMVDYNAWERPAVFGKLGFLGDLTAMLTRYKFNQIDQFARASKYVSQGKIGPMMAVLGSSIAAAGVRGLMAYTLANQLVQATTTWAAQNNLMTKPTSIDEMLLHALHGSNQHLADAVKFGLPSGLGINMTGSLSHADDIPNDPLGSLIPQKEPLMDMAKSAYDFVRDPNKATAKTAAYDLAPNSAKGLIENSLFTDANGRYTNPHSHELQTVRTPGDQTKRAMGFRPMNEANESLTTRVNEAQGKTEGAVKADVIQKVLRQYDSGNKPNLQPYISKYVANNGDPQDIIKAIVEHQGMGQARTAEQRAQGIPKGNSLNSLFNYQRMENLK